MSITNKNNLILGTAPHPVGTKRGLDLIEAAINNGSLLVVEREKTWIDRIREEIYSIPDNEDQFVEEMLPALDESKFLKGESEL